MKSFRVLEPGVLATFRLFIGVQFVIYVFSVITHSLVYYRPQSEMIALSIIGAVESGLLFIYLSLPKLQDALKSFYLPIGVGWASIGPIIEPHLVLHVGGASVPAVFEIVLWQQVVVLFIPLIVISWQYAMPQVILFCALTAATNIVLLSSGGGLTQVTLSGSVLGTLVIEMVAFLLVGHMIVSLLKIQRGQRKSLTEANQRLAQYASTVEQLTISRERNRLARELHDVLAHTLSGVAVELEGLRAMLVRDPVQASGLLNNSLRAVREGLAEARRALQELRAKPLEDLGLALALRTLAESVADRAGCRIDVIVENNLGDFPVELEQCIYRISQEALTNIANHAQAKSAQLILKREHAQIRLTINDDGCGFDPNALDGNNKYGLRGMRERAEVAGGNLSVESQVGKGTKIVFSWGGN